MSVPNNVYPHTRAEDERLVKRGQASFALGEIKDLDPVDLPNQSVAELINMRATASGLHGRPGSFAWTSLKLPFIFDESTSATTITRTGATVTATEDVFLPEWIGYKIRTADNRAFVIDDYTDARTITVVGKDVTGTETLTGCTIRGPIYASYTDEVTGDSYYLIGTSLYGRKGDEEAWNEYFVIDTIKPYSSTSTFYKIRDYVCLSNQNGIYVLNDIEDGLYAFRANIELPVYKLNRREFASEIEKNTPAPSSYNYSYGYTKIKDTYSGSRYNSDAFIFRETPGYIHLTEDADNTSINPSYLPDGKNTDLTTIVHDRPIGNYKYLIMSITDEDKNSSTHFKTLYEEGEQPFLEVVFNNEKYVVYFDFSNVKSMEDVRAVIERDCRNFASKNIRVHLNKYDNSGIRNAFEFYSVSNEDTLDLNVVSFATGLNLAQITGDPTLEFIGSAKNKSIIQYLRAPSNSKDITSYSIYRSPDIYPHTLDVPDLNDLRIANKPNLLGLIDDVPACRLVRITMAGNPYDMYVNGGTMTEADVGNTVTYLNNSLQWVSTKITGINDNGSFSVENGQSATGRPAYFGASTIREISKENDIVTVTDGDLFTSDDVGKLLYWQDGSYSVIKYVITSVGKAVTVDSTSRTSEYCLSDLTYRVYNDIVTDADLINGYIPEFPYNMRFFQPMPNTNIAASENGYLVTASRDQNTVYYSQTTQIERIGYHNATKQLNKSIEEGIKSIVSSGSYFTVCTSTDSFLINPQQARDFGNADYGESYFILPEPVLASSGIGSTHQSKWSEGMNSGLVAVTNEPAVRFYDGVKYGQDFAEGAIRRTELQKMDSMIVIGYDPNSGIFLWGRGV